MNGGGHTGTGAKEDGELRHIDAAEGSTETRNAPIMPTASTVAPEPFNFTSPFFVLDRHQLGPTFWARRRFEWTHQDPGPSASSAQHHDRVKEELQKRRVEGTLTKGMGKLSEEAQLRVYEKCVDQRKGFSRPINLEQMIPVLKAGWIRNGTWPRGQEAPPDSP